MTAAQLPTRARVVIVGGGVIGASIAYHLAHAGCTDVVLLERDRLTSGTTWHAAGLMTCFGSLSHTSTAIRLYGRELYSRLEAETGQATGFRPVGLVEAAADDERWHEFRRVAAFQRTQGLEVHEISPREVGELFPLARVDDLRGGFWVPGDGRVNPVDLTMALVKGARALGVRVVEGVTVEQVRVTGGRVAGVVARPTRGRDPDSLEAADPVAVEAEVVVLAAGMWTCELAARIGVPVPNQAAEHYYLITEPIDGVHADLPVFEDPASHGYYREEGGGLMVGLFEPHAAAWRVGGIPEEFSFGALEPDWERVEPFLRTAMERVPVTLGAGIRTFFCGPESFTPDLLPAVGEVSSLPGLFVCAGLNSVGVLSAGGWGRVLAHWVTTGRPDVDVTAVHVDRFHPHQLTARFRRERTGEILGTVYAAHPPGRQLQSARGLKRMPLHDRHIAHGAAMVDASGWEVPAFYAGAGQTPRFEPSWHRRPWFDHWRAEHEAVREAAGLMDMSFMTTVSVEGPAAAEVLERVSAGHVAGEVGRITYTPWLGEDGGIEADLTVTRTGEQEFLVVASDTAHGHVLGWLRRHAAVELHERRVHIGDVTAAYAQLNLHGPRARDVLAGATDADLDDIAFPFRTARWIEVGCAQVLAIRITYVGELGWELHLPVEFAGHVDEVLWEAGRSHGLRRAGLRALSSLRLEKGYRDYGHDLDNTDDVAVAGLGFAVSRDKPGEWIGRTAALAALAAGPPRSRLVGVLLQDPEPLLHHGEVVLRDGTPVGAIRSGSYGWTLGAAVGLAHVTRPDGTVTQAWLDEGRWCVDVAGELYAARLSLRPFYDPEGDRVRG